jgi:hypothetical protein
VSEYETAINTGKFVVVAHGTPEEVSRAHPRAATEHQLANVKAEPALVTA